MGWSAGSFLLFLVVLDQKLWKSIGFYGVPCLGALSDSIERRAKEEGERVRKMDQKSKQKAPQRDLGKSIKK